MAATDAQILVAAARWADEGSYLREFVTKHRLPAAVKVTKGQYGGLGVPSLPCPGLQSTALLVSAGRRHKIVAQAVKLKEGRRVVAVGPRLAIPDTYVGYFELLSEEGRAARCLDSVAEVARRRPEDGCLVREPVRGVAARVDAAGAVTPEGARTVAVGEVLVPAGELSLPSGATQGATTTTSRFLRCRDSRGAHVLLPLEGRGKFSPLAREDSISGVHTARSLLRKRLPLTVRLVHGAAPRGPKGTAAPFVPELRLLSTFEEEHVFALPLHREAHQVAALPLAAPLKVLRARNEEQLRGMGEFRRLAERCSRLAAEQADRIQVLDGKIGGVALQTQTPVSSTGYLLRRSTSSDAADRRLRRHSQRRDENRAPTEPSPATDYDDIDQIYDYVRGFAPLPRSASRPDASKPEPPPIETIPTKKLQAEKRKGRTPPAASPVQPLSCAASPVLVPSGATPSGARVDKSSPPPGGLPKLYIKHGQSQRAARLLRQKSSSPLKETPPSPAGAPKGGSPLFHIRYKSLSNLQQAMELDGTLDSSHSGGRASGDSGAGAKQPEKRSRRLSRPRSLTNLVWEVRALPEPMAAAGARLGKPPEVSSPPAPPPPPPRAAAAAAAAAYKRALAKYAVGGAGVHRRAGTLYL